MAGVDRADAAALQTPDPAACTAFDAGGSRLLSHTGLYANILARTLAPDVLRFEPAFALWSDGAEKQRFLKLPKGTQIDTSDMDHWRFPVGTRIFKEFALNGVLLETRLIERTGNSGQSSDYSLSSFVWLANQCDAVETFVGATSVLGTSHDVPSSRECSSCHAGEPGRVLGFSAIQLSKPGLPPTLLSVSRSGWLTNPPPSGVDYPVPGDPVARAALGYLHANCGHCHNPQVWPPNVLSQDLRLNVADRTPESTTIWQTTVGQPTQWFHASGIIDRIAAGDPDASAIAYRIAYRIGYPQMPPVATKVVDAAGVAAIRAWIASIPR